MLSRFGRPRPRLTAPSVAATVAYAGALWRRFSPAGITLPELKMTISLTACAVLSLVPFVIFEIGAGPLVSVILTPESDASEEDLLSASCVGLLT